jgi:hypothetical protein
MHALKAQLVLYRCTSRFESRQAASPAFCWGKERERSLLVLARISSIFCWSSSEIRTNTNPAVSVRSALPHSHTHKKLVFHTTRVTQRNEPDPATSQFTARFGFPAPSHRVRRSWFPREQELRCRCGRAWAGAIRRRRVNHVAREIMLVAAATALPRRHREGPNSFPRGLAHPDGGLSDHGPRPTQARSVKHWPGRCNH